MNKEDFENLVKKNHILTKITPDNAKQKCFELINLQHKYMYLLFKERRILKDINTNKDKIYKELYHEYRYCRDKFKFELKNKTEIEVYIFADGRYDDIYDRYTLQKEIVTYLEEFLNLLSKISFSMNNYIDFEKLRQGE